MVWGGETVKERSGGATASLIFGRIVEVTASFEPSFKLIQHLMLMKHTHTKKSKKCGNPSEFILHLLKTHI